MTSISYPGFGHIVNRTFDGADELSSVTTWLGGPGTCNGINYPTDTTTFSYDLDGNLTSSTLPTCDSKNTPNGPDVISRTYNSDNTLSSIYGTFNGSNGSLDYTSNGLGYVTSRTANGGTPTNYSYNAMGQVVSSASGTNTTNFEYDSAGNVTCNQAGQYQTYNSLGQLSVNYQNCGSTAAPQDNFTYDAYGDRIQELVPWGTSSVPLDYEYYNSVGEMTGYTAFFTQTNYSYAGNGQLIQISQGSTSLDLAYNEAVPIPEIISDSNWDFIYGPDNQVFEAINLTANPSTPVYLINDINGSPIANLSLDGKINNAMIYNTWGSPTSSSSPTPPPIGFDNAYYDGFSGFYYLNNRFYDLNTGQFITQDPRILATNQPWGYAGSANPTQGGQYSAEPAAIDQTQIYQFANDNPVTQRDMSGLCSSGCNALLSLAFTNASFTMMSMTLLSMALEIPAAMLLGPAGVMPVLVVSLIGAYLVWDEATKTSELAKMCRTP
jgi:RHS repeat-associated protein